MMMTTSVTLTVAVIIMEGADSLAKTLMGEIEGGRRKTTEDEMVGWHH